MESVTTQPPAFTLAPRVASVRAVPNAPVIEATFENGQRRTVDLTRFLDSPVFAPLKDQAARAAVRVINNGRGIEWECGADLSAETLWG